MASGTPKKKASSDQLNFLVDFIAGNKILLHGKTKPSEADNNTIDKLWDELTLSLNAMGSGPQKSKAQWKKTFIDWKSHTKKKARECVKSEQRTGGGEGDGKALTPIEEKEGADVHEIGFEPVNAEPQLYNDVITEVHMDDRYLDGPEETVEITVLPGSSKLKRPAESQPYVEPKRKATTAKDKGSNLQKAAKAYAVGQRETATILERLVALKDSPAETDPFRQRELDLKEFELKVRCFEAKNKKREELKELELKIRHFAAENKKRELDVREKELEERVKREGA
ncbi:uncharacterized protein LOC126892499 [Diabrotica virgifera virgifera]|uniref:Regulatory protein zeste n=1 Tax=Diabrotica virgifera virgifera TaxID=50390 RepID=A0ABM5L6D6_DIAVI|nr:uncharacterized protein LOC126892499 [Diabrotica virgifera virgifera]